MKTAVLGLGFMGATHIKALAGIPGVELAAVFDVDRKRLTGDLSSVQGNIGGPAGVLDFSLVRKYDDLDALLANKDIDAVDICLPTNLHTDAAIRALRAGKHVLVEKPIALDGDAADRVLAEAEKSGRILMAAQVLRFSPQYVALREAICGGRLGRMRAATFRRRCAAPAWGGWLKDPSRSGGGVFDLLIHDVDMCIHLFGKPEMLSATGFTDAEAGLDCLHGQLLYPGGAAVLVSGGWYHAGAYPFTTDYSVVLEGGTVEYSSTGGSPALYRLNQPEEKLPMKQQDGYAAEIGYFVECCLTESVPTVCPPLESAAAVKLMLALLEARKRNGEVISCRI